MIDSLDSSPFIFRKTELEQISTALVQDCDLIVTGVPGIGRRTLVRSAARQVGVRHLEIDCLRCRSAKQFVQLFIDSINAVFSKPNEITKINQWISAQPSPIGESLSTQNCLVWTAMSGKEWTLFEHLLSLPQFLAEALNCRAVIVFHNLAHIRIWDRQRKWETRLLQEIQQQQQVSYVLVAIVADLWTQEVNLPIVALGPLSDQDMQTWITHKMAAAKLSFATDDQGLAAFVRYVQGHIKDAIALAQRIQLICHADWAQGCRGEIQAHHVHSSMCALVKDVEVTFETLLLLLPPTQAKLLESLSLDPTDRPQASAYIRKHHLSRGGSLQGALSSLEQKGLVYGSQLGFRVSLPLLDFWIQQSQYR